MEATNSGLRADERGEDEGASPAPPQPRPDRVKPAPPVAEQKYSVGRPGTASPGPSPGPATGHPPGPGPGNSPPSPTRLSPDQNSNSVRDLEAAMSKHLPRESGAGAGLLAGPGGGGATLLAQLYGGRGGYGPEGVPDHHQLLQYARLGYTTAPGPAPSRPLYSPAVAGVEAGLAGYAEQSHNLYSHTAASFSLYNRSGGQGWYHATGN